MLKSLLERGSFDFGYRAGIQTLNLGKNGMPANNRAEMMIGEMMKEKFAEEDEMDEV